MELSLSEDEDGDLLVVRGTVAKGIEVRPTRYGRGLFATTSFAKGQVLYRGAWVAIPNVARPVVLRTPNEDFDMTVLTHSVLMHESNRRQLYGFDGFMNHSCSPNTYSANEVNGLDGGSYDTVALRDIAPGEEITCDYDLFEWDCEDKGIEACGCNADSCRKRVVGFKFLPPHEQKRLIACAYLEVQESYYKAMGLPMP